MHLLRKKRTRFAIALSAVLLTAAAIAFGVAISADPPESGPAVRSHAEHADIWTVNVQTRALTRQTLYADALEPSWSSDGKIAFSTADCDECNSEIHLDGSGSTEVPVETTVRHVYQPSWAPDGKRFAVVRLGRGIWSVDVASKSAKRLTVSPSDEAPAWSPNGDWIAFDRLHHSTTNYELYAVHSGTGERRRLTQDPAAQTNPAWSPDGSRLAFAEQQSNGKWSIFTMGFDGNGRTRITGSQISAQEPAWSPDGKRIAFILQELDRGTVAMINSDGTGSVVELTDKSLFASRPTWSPGGTSIAFSALVVP
jgi:Tol biopolymer transport system component